jgi:hypothetical protein
MRAYNANASDRASMKILPVRCFPMKIRPRKAFALDGHNIPKVWQCSNAVFYDRHGRLGPVCAPDNRLDLTHIKAATQ